MKCGPNFDCSQNFWQLASIAGVGFGLPAMVVGGQLALKYGAGTALLSILIANLFLWTLGLGIISMAYKRKHAIENVREYLGENTAKVAALLWIISFLTWYAIQLQGISDITSQLMLNIEPWKIGIFWGLLVACLSLGGFFVLKHICVFCLPLLLAYVIYAIWTHSSVLFSGTWNISLSGIIAALIVWLPGIINLPTLTRHSSSQAQSILGLSLMIFFHVILQTFTIFIGMTTPTEFLAPYLNTAPINIVLLSAFAFAVLAYVCINLLNIYLASVAWETTISKIHDRKEYLFVGLLGTVLYLCAIPYSLNVQLLEVIMTSFMASLGIVLSINFLIRIVVRHRPRPWEKLASSLCWLIGCMASLSIQVQLPNDTQQAFEHTKGPLFGILASAFAFLILLFVEETIWSLKHLPKRP